MGKAAVVRGGREVTLVTWGSMLHIAQQAADQLSSEDVEVEIIDLRTLTPWDKDTVLTSIRKTNRALVLHEANITGGIGAEIASIISDETFEFLDAPVKRIASLDTPIPFATNIESNVYLPHNRLEAALRELLEY